VRLTKYTHACVLLEQGDRRLLVDPGIWAEDAAFEGVEEVLVTHEHFDHLDVDRLVAAGRASSSFVVRGPASVVQQLAALGDAAVAVSVGDAFTAGGLSVRVVGGEHAEIYDGAPGIANLGYLIEGSEGREGSEHTVYHPGDSYFVPSGEGSVHTLLVPTAAPWLKISETIDFIRAVAPSRAHSIHDAITNDKGAALVDRWLDLEGHTDYTRIPIGSSVDG
jgi:L-ascorbate metabolism protein UlaG (beta-lactamase superfamily)